jgi:magnesium transporter
LRVLTILARAAGDHFEGHDLPDLPRLLAAPDTLVWVDLEAPDDAEVAVLSAVFGFHQLTIDDCLNRYVDPPKADDYGDYVFLIAQGIAFAPAPATKAEAIETTELNLYLGRSFLVTFHHRPLEAVSAVRDRCGRGAPVPSRGADWLMHALLDALVDQLLPAVEAIDESIAGLHDRALVSTDRSIMERLTVLKRATLRFRRLVTPQRDLINRLSRGDFPALIRPETHMHFRDIYDHMVRLEGMIEGLRDLDDSAISAYLAAVNNRLSEITKTLAVAGTIFLPLTLVASIFGTNFSPTYEDWGWTGFLGMCAFMLVSMAALMLWFKRRGWL